MDSFKEKQVKEKLNEALQSSEMSENPHTSSSSTNQDESRRSLEEIQDIFEKTEAMKKVAKLKNQQLEEQFKDLKQRLNSSSEYLLRIKKNIENLKFSYQRNVLEINNKLDPGTQLESGNIGTKEDMTKHMEEIRKKIDDLQNKMTVQQQKQQNVTENYQEAFDKVIDTLQQIETGAYSSQSVKATNE
ncbi:hypothetical protein JTB14_009573 [Gonioctena quinquepunctata]|nr:hypothetical protein JTB14_009573 [Gonioctena quinquepunctata]